MDLADDPVENGLAGPICGHGEGPHVHTADAPHGASDSDKLGALALLLQQWKRGLEQIKGSEPVDGDVFLDDGRVTGRERGEVVADARVGDDEVEAGDSLFLERCDRGGGVGLGLVVDLHNDEFAGRAFGDGGELLRCRVLRIANAGDDGRGRAGEVDFDEAEADAWGTGKGRGLKRMKKGVEECSPRLAPVMRTLVAPSASILTESFLKSLAKKR